MIGKCAAFVMFCNRTHARFYHVIVSHLPVNAIYADKEAWVKYVLVLKCSAYRVEKISIYIIVSLLIIFSKKTELPLLLGIYCL